MAGNAGPRETEIGCAARFRLLLVAVGALGSAVHASEDEARAFVVEAGLTTDLFPVDDVERSPLVVSVAL